MRLLVLSSLAAGVVLAAAIGCSSNESGVSGSSKLPSGTRSKAIEHEACEESGNRVESVDVNNDGKTDIRRVYDKKTAKEVCRIVDLNRDGKPDLYEYFDAGGTVRRREYAYSDDGVVNAIEYFENGKLARREYDTTGQHKIDTWDFFDPQAPVDPRTKRPRPNKRERDTNGDGAPDQWWSWEGEKVTILMDKNSDGKPDPEATIVMGGAEDGGAPEAAAPPPAPVAASDDAGAAATDAGGNR